MAISCQAFTDILIRRSEHLDDEILRDATPQDSLVGSIETGKFSSEDGVSHTFDTFNRVFPDMSTAWEDVNINSCIGSPCAQSETQIGMGTTRQSYKLQRKRYASQLICYDLTMSADKATEQYANYVRMLKESTLIINSNRIINEYFRNAGQKWVATTTALQAITYTETGDLITVTPSTMPTSQLTVNHLEQRVDYQLLSGALGEVVKGQPPEIQVLASMETIRSLMQTDQAKFANWRFTDFETASVEYYKFGWKGRVGNFVLKATIFPMRFNFQPGTGVLKRVFPYVNIAASQGIKGDVNAAYLTAPVEATFIWHQRAMKILMLNPTSINPNMPFAARDFAGKWMFKTNNISCGTATAKDANGNDIQIPIMVDNTMGNQGKFVSEFVYATKPQFPKYAEVILALRAPACIAGAIPCGIDYTYATQSYNSANTPCP